MKEDMIDINETVSIEKPKRGKKILIFILKVLMLFTMPIILSILDHYIL
jgi:hypothetical protein